MIRNRHKLGTKEGLPPQMADRETADQGGRGLDAAGGAACRPVSSSPKNFLENEPNCFGEVLGVMSRHELVRICGRLKKCGKLRTAEIISDEIDERKAINGEAKVEYPGEQWG